MTSTDRSTIFVDEEIQVPAEGAARGLLAPKSGKMTLVNETTVVRAVLGENRQNISQQLLKPPNGQVRSTILTICDA